MIDAFNILLVEDSDTDADITIRALKTCAPETRLNRVCDGSEAIQYLHREGHFSGSPQPDLILLDLNMPNIDGRELLRRMRSDEKTRLIPVVVLTTSSNDLDVLVCYQLFANAYVVKPIDFGEFLNVMESLSNFWLRIAKLPSRRMGL